MLCRFLMYMWSVKTLCMSVLVNIQAPRVAPPRAAAAAALIPRLPNSAHRRVQRAEPEPRRARIEGVASSVELKWGPETENAKYTCISRCEVRFEVACMHL